MTEGCRPRTRRSGQGSSRSRRCESRIDVSLKRLGPEKLAGLNREELARQVLDDLKAEGDNFILEFIGKENELTISWCPHKNRVKKMGFKRFKDLVAERWRLSQK